MFGITKKDLEVVADLALDIVDWALDGFDPMVPDVDFASAEGGGQPPNDRGKTTSRSTQSQGSADLSSPEALGGDSAGVKPAAGANSKAGPLDIEEPEGGFMAGPRWKPSPLDSDYSTEETTYPRASGKNFDCNECQDKGWVTLELNRRGGEMVTSNEPCDACDAHKENVVLRKKKKTVFDPETFRAELKEAHERRLEIPVLPINPDHDKLVNDLVNEADARNHNLARALDGAEKLLRPLPPKLYGRSSTEMSEIMNELNKALAEQLVLQTRVVHLENQVEEYKTVMVEMGNIFRRYRDTGKLPGSV